jgi:hypothetical protein
MVGEELEFFRGKAVEMDERIAAMPKLYEADGLGDRAMVMLHYFAGGADWYLYELDRETLEAFGLADLGFGFPELGYIPVPEIVAAGAELDLHFKPRPLTAVRKP